MLLLLLGCSAGPDTAAPADTAAPFEAPEAPADGVQLHVPAVTLAPGEERERCLYLPAANTEDAWIRAIELVSRPGLHHAMLVKAHVEAGGEARTDEEPCFGIPEDVMADYTNVPEPIFASSTGVTEESIHFPDGVAVPLPANQPLMVNYHLLNTGDAEITGELFVNLHFADPATEPEAARLYAMGSLLGIDIPAHGEQTLTTTCTFPRDASVLSLTPHMHQRGRAFAAEKVHDGVATELLSTDRWSNPETAWFAPPVEVSAGDGLRFTCSWTNDGDEPVGFGPTADDEMCMVFGYHWPADDLLWRADYDEEACTRE